MIHAQRYSSPISAASATRDNSRQTDSWETPAKPIARLCHAFFPLSVTARQRFRCSIFAGACGVFRTGAERNDGTCLLRFKSLERRGLRRRRLAIGFVEFAVQRRASDFETACHLRHLTAVVGDGEADDLM